MDDTWRRGIHHVDEEHREGIARPDREHEFPERLNPVVGWSIVLIVSLGLWWGIWLAVSSLVLPLR